MAITEPTTDATDSVAQAKAYQRQERDKVRLATGLHIRDDGQHATPFLVRCPRCEFHASAKSEGRAVQGIVSHLVRVHFPQEQK